MVCELKNKRDQRITVSDFLNNGCCKEGIKKWHLENNLDLGYFLKNGYSIHFLESFNNPHINRVLKKRGF